MKKLLFVLLLFNQVGFAGDTLEISILTCAPGNEIYSIFGHSAIRIFDSARKSDKIYDFGSFDFNTPNFEYQFLKGKLKYHLSSRNTAGFITSYTHENRAVFEQKLNLTDLQIKQVIDRLNFLYQPANRFYYYSFLQKDCSTDLRDLLVFIGVKFSDEPLNESNRGLINSYLKEMPWLKLGINIILGRLLDEKSNRFQSMFLPDYLKREINQSYINTLPLTKSRHTLNSVKPSVKKRTWVKIFSPLVIFSILLIVYIMGIQKPIHLLLSGGLGIGGLFLLLLWIFSGHEEVRNNLNILWCNPFYLLYLPMVVRNKTNKIVPTVLLISLLFTIIVWLFKVQCFDRSIIPLLIVLGLINYRELVHHKAARDGKN